MAKDYDIIRDPIHGFIKINNLEKEIEDEKGTVHKMGTGLIEGKISGDIPFGGWRTIQSELRRKLQERR